MGRGSSKFQSKFVQQREEKIRVVQPTAEQKAENLKKAALKQKRKTKQETLDRDFKRAGITEKQLKDAQMNRAEIKKLIQRAKDNGLDQQDVKDEIDFDTDFENNVRKSPIFADSLKDFRKPDDMTPREKEWAEDYYLLQAEKDPKKAIKDSKHEQKPVRTSITKPWIKSPFSKKGADIEDIDDGSNPLSEDDFK